MSQWLRNLRGALKMGLTWAIAWGIGVGGLFELVGNIWPGAPLVGLVDIWPMVLGIPGFLSGTVFAFVLRLSDGRRRFEQLSIPRFATLGAVGGLLSGAITVAVVIAAAGAPSFWIQAAAVCAVPTVLSTLSAVGTLALARQAEGGARLSEPRPDELPGGANPP
jgi:hypothetical protein